MKTIELVTPENKIRSNSISYNLFSNEIIALAKQDSVFLVECVNRTVKIYGSHLQLRVIHSYSHDFSPNRFLFQPGDRARMKFKMKFLREFCS